ncbi:hypothetical protein [Parafilimonas sp.]|uniref:hypothetical protein n=1 Tax=Parafilimonas sp. TaxID=1969739 RepID=UPI0039E64AA4
MSTITLKTAKRATSVPRSKIRKAVEAAYAEPMPAHTPAVVVRVTKKTAPKHAVKAS